MSALTERMRCRVDCAALGESALMLPALRPDGPVVGSLTPFTEYARKNNRVDASGTTRPIGFGKPWLQAATGRMISKEKGIAGILSTLRSPATI
jgi:hypothetical protein